MWDRLIEHFRRYPAQERVVKLMIHHGFRINPADHKIFAGPIELADTAVGRAANVDRRIVQATIRTILEDAELAQAFTRFAPTMHLKDAAPPLGLGVIEIIPTNASRPGILAGVSRVIAEHGHSIRQAIVDDPDFTDQPRLFVVTEAAVTGDLVPDLQRVQGVRAVTVY